jgi:hypothetical protein
MLSVRPVDVLDPDVDELVEPDPPMLTLSTVPFTYVVAAVPPEVAPAYTALNV